MALQKRKTDRYVEESMTILVEAEAEWKAKHDAQDAANARLRALGNAVVPQVVFPLAVALREWLEAQDAGAAGECEA